MPNPGIITGGKNTKTGNFSNYPVGSGQENHLISGVVNIIPFTFTSDSGSDTITQVELTIPNLTGWTTPQNTDPLSPGYVSISNGTCTTFPGSFTIDGNKIIVGTGDVSSLACENGQTFNITYTGVVAIPGIAYTIDFVTRTKTNAVGSVLDTSSFVQSYVIPMPMQMTFAPAHMHENAASGVVCTFTRWETQNTPLTVVFDISSYNAYGSASHATYGEDYNINDALTFAYPQGTVVISADEPSTSITFTPIVDDIDDAHEQVVVHAQFLFDGFESPTGYGDLRGFLIDPRFITVSVAPTTIDGKVSLVFTFTRTEAPTGDTYIYPDMTGTALYGDDYTVTGAEYVDTTYYPEYPVYAEILIPDGESSVNVTVTPVDTLSVPKTVTFGNIYTDVSHYITGVPDSATGTIQLVAAGSSSTSPSASSSLSGSPSASTSLSASPSASRSPSASTSLSVSPSASTSLSASPSASISPSASESLSTSPSSSASPSASPSPTYEPCEPDVITMPSINTQKYATYVAKQFAQSANTNGLYLGIGRPQAWDGDPLAPIGDTQNVDFAYWRDLLGLKRISANSDVSLVIRRHNWQAFVKYEQYDDTNESLYAPTCNAFYVVDTTANDDRYYVYKCLWNNYGGLSTIAPALGVGNNIEPTTLADGYVWKYMYRISGEQFKFVTKMWIPVLRDNTVAAYATTIAGQLPVEVPLIVTESDHDFDPSDTTTVMIDGDGHDASIVLSSGNFVANTVTNLSLFSGGIGYTKIDDILLTQDTQIAHARAIIPPYPNHGYNPATELGASAVMLAVDIEDDMGGKLTTINDYSRVILVSNPANANNDIATDTYYRMTYDVELSGSNTTPPFAPDDIVVLTDTEYDAIGGGNIASAHPVTARVVDVINTLDGRTYVRLTDVNDKGRTGVLSSTSVAQNTYMSGDVIACDAKIASVSGMLEPELELFSGDVLYVNHHTMIQRDSNQLEQFKLVFKFGSYTPTSNSGGSDSGAGSGNAVPTE